MNLGRREAVSINELGERGFTVSNKIPFFFLVLWGAQDVNLWDVKNQINWGVDNMANKFYRATENFRLAAAEWPA